MASRSSPPLAELGTVGAQLTHFNLIHLVEFPEALAPKEHVLRSAVVLEVELHPADRDHLNLPDATTWEALLNL